MDFQTFLYQLYHLDARSLFVAYLCVSFILPHIWKKIVAPLELKWVLIVYNATCSLLNLYTFVGMVHAVLSTEELFSNSESPALLPWYRIYGYLKIFELMDTVFMILRHRNRQITFLHVFHHSTMVLLIQYALQYSPWPALAPALSLNCLVHVLMHFYYGLTAYLESSARPTWKRRVTELQMAQFVLDLIYSSYGLYRGKMCIWSFLYGLSMLTLFGNFYVHAYILSKSARKSADNNVTHTPTPENTHSRKEQ